jgi:hypothetical protein
MKYGPRANQSSCSGPGFVEHLIGTATYRVEYEGPTNFSGGVRAAALHRASELCPDGFRVLSSDVEGYLCPSSNEWGMKQVPAAAVIIVCQDG